MKAYLNQHVDMNDDKLVSVVDDLPLWSAPFGLKLLDTIQMKKGITVLDIGCGLGFPALEIAMRLGNTGKVYGIDPWTKALNRAQLKKEIYHIENVNFIQGYAENMPFEDNFFDLIVSNNGINNVSDMNQTMQECSRVSKPDAQLTITLNLDETMIEFYRVLQESLQQHKMLDEIQNMKQHIYSKRRPLSEIITILEHAQFDIINISHDSFQFRFSDGTSMLNHYLIRYWFMDSWKNIMSKTDLEKIFDCVELKLNEIAELNGEIILSIPFVTIDCRRK